MIWRRTAQTVALTAVAAGLGWLLFVGLPRWYGPRAPGAVVAAPSQPPAPPGRKIKAHLFYVADDGTQLTSVERDVTYGEGTIEQAKAIIDAQIAPATEPLVSPIPA